MYRLSVAVLGGFVGVKSNVLVYDVRSCIAEAVGRTVLSIGAGTRAVMPLLLRISAKDLNVKRNPLSFFRLILRPDHLGTK